MPITVTLDVVENSSIDIPNAILAQPKTFVRTGIVDGIDVSGISGAPKYEAMWQATAACIEAAAADPLTNYPDMVLMRVLLDPLSDTQARARLIYQNIIFGTGIPPSTYVLTDRAFMTTRTTNFLPGTRQKISSAWQQPSNVHGYHAIPEDFIPLNILFPMRVIQVEALIYGRPTSGQQFLGCVNDTEWPTTPPTWPGVPDQGPTPLPAGYWLLTDYSTRISRIGGYYALTAQATSRVVEDWSECGILQDTQTGKYVQIVPGDIDAGNDIITALFSTPYSYGITDGVNPNSPTDTGVVRVGPYKTASFQTIFGF